MQRNVIKDLIGKYTESIEAIEKIQSNMNIYRMNPSCLSLTYDGKSIRLTELDVTIFEDFLSNVLENNRDKVQSLAIDLASEYSYTHQ